MRRGAAIDYAKETLVDPSSHGNGYSDFHAPASITGIRINPAKVDMVTLDFGDVPLANLLQDKLPILLVAGGIVSVVARGELWIRDPGLEVGARFFQP
jgi:hypothetical protein